ILRSSGSGSDRTEKMPAAPRPVSGSRRSCRPTLHRVCSGREALSLGEHGIDSGIRVVAATPPGLIGETVPSPRKPILLIAAAGITALLGVEYLRLLGPAQAREVQAACTGMRPTVNNKAIGTLPNKAPAFNAQDHSGKMVKLSDFRGKVVLVRFWASWCETCKAEQPSLEDLAGDVDPDDAVV